jgi:hypothetical protein
MSQGLLDFFTNPSEKDAKQKEMMQRQMEAQRLMQQAYGGSQMPFDINAQIESVPGLAGIVGGGRVGTQIQLTPQQALILGMSGGGSYLPGIAGGKQFKANSIDAMLQTPSGGYGVQLNRKDPYNPTLPQLMLNYNRQF